MTMPANPSRDEGTPRPFAALITIDFENQNVMWSIFDDTFRDGDPILAAHALRQSIEDDWPNHEQHVIGNEVAREIYGRRRVARWLGDPS